MSRISKRDMGFLLFTFIVVLIGSLGASYIFLHLARVVVLGEKDLEARTIIKTAPESKVLLKRNSIFDLGYTVVVKIPNMTTESIFVSSDDYLAVKPGDTVCVQYSQLDGKNQDFQLCPKK